jgi:hypothetical protein
MLAIILTIISFVKKKTADPCRSAERLELSTSGLSEVSCPTIHEQVNHSSAFPDIGTDPH